MGHASNKRAIKSMTQDYFKLTLACGLTREFTSKQSHDLFNKLHDKKCEMCRNAIPKHHPKKVEKVNLCL